MGFNVSREPIIVDCAILPEVVPSLPALRKLNAVHEVTELEGIICDFVLVLHIEIIGYPWADVNINLGFFSVVSACAARVYDQRVGALRFRNIVNPPCYDT